MLDYKKKLLRLKRELIDFIDKIEETYSVYFPSSQNIEKGLNILSLKLLNVLPDLRKCTIAFRLC